LNQNSETELKIFNFF